MKTERVNFVLTVISLLALASTFYRVQSAASSEALPVLRCRELYLVDEQGRTRMELKVTPPQPNLKMPDGSIGFPESVLFRLFSSTGAPYVKIGANEDGAGMVLGGNGVYVQILSRGTNTPFVKIAAKDGREQVMKVQ
jgi:hypothetical protein